MMPRPCKRSDGRPAQDAVSPIDLPEILEAIRNDEPAHQEPPPPPEAKPASQKPSTPGDAEADPLAAAIDERASDPASAESVAAKPARPNAQGSRVPIVTASSHVSTDATERMRRLEEEKLRLARKPGRVGELPGEAEEAAVTFVIREEAQATPPTAAPSTPSRSPHCCVVPRSSGSRRRRKQKPTLPAGVLRKRLRSLSSNR